MLWLGLSILQCTLYLYCLFIIFSMSGVLQNSIQSSKTKESHLVIVGILRVMHVIPSCLFKHISLCSSNIFRKTISALYKDITYIMQDAEEQYSASHLLSLQLIRLSCLFFFLGNLILHFSSFAMEVSYGQRRIFQGCKADCKLVTFYFSGQLGRKAMSCSDVVSAHHFRFLVHHITLLHRTYVLLHITCTYLDSVIFINSQWLLTLLCVLFTLHHLHFV